MNYTTVSLNSLHRKLLSVVVPCYNSEAYKFITQYETNRIKRFGLFRFSLDLLSMMLNEK